MVWCLLACMHACSAPASIPYARQDEGCFVNGHFLNCTGCFIRDYVEGKGMG